MRAYVRAVGLRQALPRVYLRVLCRSYRLACRLALWLGFIRLGYALSERADELVRQAVREGRPVQRRRRRRPPGGHADNGVRWVGAQLGAGFVLVLLYLGAGVLGWVPLP